jgi:replication factor C subunit 3/5
MESKHCPWVEKYRPHHFQDIVLDPLNRKILGNIIETSYFPHLLFYGPPGTGKTTTIINLVKAYQEKINPHFASNKGLMIHLNASDDRGIDMIRNQIHDFVYSKPLFQEGMKFLILDEVDYMTKNAQQALRYLIQNVSNQVRFCLICNYISRIDDRLQNEFLRLRFNQLPEADMMIFLKQVCLSENLDVSENALLSIQKLYKSDIRSMLNCLQNNQNIKDNLKIIDNPVWENFLVQIQTQPVSFLVDWLQNQCAVFNMDRKNIIKHFLNFFIRNYIQQVTPDFLDIVKSILHHNNHLTVNDLVYFSHKIKEFLSHKKN